MQIVLNLFYLLVVVAVLVRIANPMEDSIIAALGMVYVAVRGSAIANGMALIAYRPHFEIPDRKEEISAIEFTRNKLCIVMFFLGLTSPSAFGNSLRRIASRRIHHTPDAQ